MTALNPADAVREAPCPFCGNVGITIREGTTFRWRVAECNHCGATCGEVRFNTTADDKLVEEINAGRRALDEWNKRPRLAALAVSNPAAEIDTSARYVDALAGAAPVAWADPADPMFRDDWVATTPILHRQQYAPGLVPLFAHAPAKAREVTDAEVERACRAYWASDTFPVGHDPSTETRHVQRMRAALATFAEVD